MARPTSDARALTVTMVTPGFPPDRGGVEEHAGQIARCLAQGGDAVRVLTAAGGRSHPGDEVTAQGVEVRRLAALPVPGMSFSPAVTVAGLRAGLRAGGHAPDAVVHVHSYHASSGFAAAAGLWRPVVFTPHYHGSGHTAAARVLHHGYGLAGRLLFRAAAAVICVSDAERDRLEADFPATRGRTVVIPNGADTQAIRGADPWPEGEPARAPRDELATVLVVGRLEPYKGVATVVESMRELPQARLVVVGNGSQEEALRRLADERGVAGRVHVLPGVSDPDLHRWLRTASVLVSMSTQEAFGMAPVEAAAAGAPVVLSAIPAHEDIARTYLGAAATLVPVSASPAALAQAVRTVLGGDGPRRVDVPDWADVAARTREVYLDVLDRAARRRR